MATKLDLLYDNANYIEHLTSAQTLVSGSETVASVHLIIWKIDSAEVYYRNIKNITRAPRKRKPPSRQP